MDVCFRSKKIFNNFLLVLVKEETSEGSHLLVIVIAATCAAILVLGMIILALCVCRHQKDKRKVKVPDKSKYKSEKPTYTQPDKDDDRYFSEVDKNPDVVPETSGKFENLSAFLVA